MREKRQSLSGDCLVCYLYPHLERSECVRHQEVSLRIAAAVLGAEKVCGTRVLQDCDIAYDQGAEVRPDIVLVRKHRRGIIGKNKVYGTPDVVIEIACECGAREALRRKRQIYSVLEVQEFWVVYPESEMVEVLVWTEIGHVLVGRYGKSDEVCSLSFPGISLPLCEIFQTNE
jgi:Uma2 family endonuclease